MQSVVIAKKLFCGGADIKGRMDFGFADDRYGLV